MPPSDDALHAVIEGISDGLAQILEHLNTHHIAHPDHDMTACDEGQVRCAHLLSVIAASCAATAGSMLNALIHAVDSELEHGYSTMRQCHCRCGCESAWTQTAEYGEVLLCPECLRLNAFGDARHGPPTPYPS